MRHPLKTVGSTQYAEGRKQWAAGKKQKADKECQT
jgi:hypothetical protein